MVAVVLRGDQAPASRIDLEDRHDTRATESREQSELYVVLRQQKRRQEWHRVAMALTVLVVVVGVYLSAFLLLTELRPRYDPMLAARLIGLGFAVAGGLLASVAVSVGRRFKAGGDS